MKWEHFHRLSLGKLVSTNFLEVDLQYITKIFSEEDYEVQKVYRVCPITHLVTERAGTESQTQKTSALSLKILKRLSVISQEG